MNVQGLDKDRSACDQVSINSQDDNETHYQLISFMSDVPAPLQAAMTSFIEKHPNWDQYRLVQAALAGFLVQNGVDSRPVTRLYLDNMFCNKTFQRKEFKG